MARSGKGQGGVPGKVPEAISRRLAALRERMKEGRIKALLITVDSDLFYLTGFTGEDSAAFITETGVHIITDGRFKDSVQRECPWADVFIRKGLLTAALAERIRRLKLRSVAVQGQGLTLDRYESLSEELPAVRMAAAPFRVASVREKKGQEELRLLGRAIRVAEGAFEATRAAIRIGQTELEIAARLEYEMKTRGASGPAFATICAEGPNAALPHAHPGKRKVKQGSAILLDWGARVERYCSDLTRMIYVGGISSKWRKLHDVVDEARRRAIAGIRPGVTVKEVDSAARTHISDQGWGEAFSHGLGHGLGLDVHEAPSVSWRTDEVLEEGMVITIEPGIYLPGFGGVRIEDDVLVTAKGARVLTHLPRDAASAVLT